MIWGAETTGCLQAFGYFFTASSLPHHRHHLFLELIELVYITSYNVQLKLLADGDMDYSQSVRLAWHVARGKAQQLACGVW